MCYRSLAMSDAARSQNVKASALRRLFAAPEPIVIVGAHDGLTTTKASVGFTVSGESVSFKNLRVYEGSVMKTWEETKAKLLADRKK